MKKIIKAKKLLNKNKMKKYNNNKIKIKIIKKKINKKVYKYNDFIKIK